jgi:hypothetical protein
MKDKKRLEAAQTLSAMGFPVRLAYYALEKAGDNGDAAVDWLLTEGIAHTEKHNNVDWLGVAE